MSTNARAGRHLRRVIALAMTGAAALAFAGSSLAQTPVERGRYLVESIRGCSNCHTPKSPDGKPIMERNLAGGITVTAPPFSGMASNITPDRETGIGSWTDAEIKRAIVDGVRPNHGRLPNTQPSMRIKTKCTTRRPCGLLLLLLDKNVSSHFLLMSLQRDQPN